MIASLVVRPFLALSKHRLGEHAYWWRYLVSGLVGAAGSFVIWLSAEAVPLTGTSGLGTRLLGLLSVLVAFYVSSIGVLLSFPAGEIDTPRPDWQELNGQIPTQRKFLLALFAHLAWLAGFGYLMGLLGTTFGPWLLDAMRLPSGWREGCRVALSFFFLAEIALLFLTTGFAVHIMSTDLPNVSRR